MTKIIKIVPKCEQCEKIKDIQNNPEISMLRL